MAKRLDHDAMLAFFETTKTPDRPRGYISQVARRFGAAYGTAKRICLGKSNAGPDRATNSRFILEPVKEGRLPAIDSAFLADKRTRYPLSVISADDLKGWALKSGHNAAKIGAVIRKGAWVGMPVYTLTLEERATCPTSCRHWRSCFGNKMNWAKRIEAGPALERRLWNEVHALGERHPDGFVVRLHILGDFYSPFYVALWGELLDRVPALRVFGYSARWDCKNDPIAKPLVALAMAQWERFAMRFSNAPTDECSTVSIEHPIQAPPGAIICPEQRGLSESCSTCALCWSTKKPIAFLQH